MTQPNGRHYMYADKPQRHEQTINQLRQIENSTENTMNILTFLKSNYKYKRRSLNMYEDDDADKLPIAAATSTAGVCPIAYRFETGSERKIPATSNYDFNSVIFTYIFSVILNNLNQYNVAAWHTIRQRLRQQTTRLSICLALFAAVCMMSASSVNAGACFQTALANGKCKEMYATNISKAECCSNQDFLYTDEVVSEVLYFFKTTLGDGMECSPCRENCKNFNCGPNKKCVQRKGRPKCICAPECGGAARRRKQLLRTQTPRKRLQRSRHDDDEPEWVSPRDTRSLSREITNINLDISSGGFSGHHQPNPMRNQNQRKPTQHSMQSHEQQQQQDDRDNSQQNELKTKRLLMATATAAADNPTQTRRIQLISNIRKHKQRNRNDTNVIEPTSADRSKDIKTNGRKNKTNHHHKHGNVDDRQTSDTTHRHQHQHEREKQQQQQHHNKRKYHHNNNNSNDQRNKLKHPKPISPAGSILIINDRDASAENVNGSSSSSTGHDMTLLDGIDEKFRQHGFPNQYHKITHFESHHHQQHPVCGTDGRTYNTECQLKKRACRTNNSNLKVAYRGYCKVTCQGVKCLNGLTCVEDHYTIPHCIECQINCPHDADDDVALAAASADVDKAGHNNHNNDERNIDGHWAAAVGNERASSAIDNDRVRNIVIDTSRAVCGVDGKTYKSTCDINRMICKIGRSIAVAYPGPCRADRVTCSDINCGPKQKCLVDYLTHEPRCVHCRYKCARKRAPQHQRFEEGKICGVNNRNYNSWCEMRKESCSTGILIDVKYPGECQ